MRISHRYQFVFISIPRSGSTSVRASLNDWSDLKDGPEDPFYHHVDCLSLKAEFEKEGWNWEKYYKFAFVRNPWDRVVSEYFRLKEKLNRNEWLINSSSYHDFTDWCERSPGEYQGEGIKKEIEDLKKQLVLNGNEKDRAARKYLGQYRHLQNVWRNQISWLCDGDGKVLVNKIGRFETLVKDFKNICSTIGIRLSLGKHGKTERGNYRKYYNKDTREMVRKRFEQDVNVFDYHF